jgi:SAM-dependent methyltransferase
LLELNRQFYQTFALQFSATRQRLQPGVQRLLPGLLQAASLLDLGCGNGELARRLAAPGFCGRYVGLDFSPGLLQDAGQDQPQAAQVSFVSGDLSQPGWQAALPQAQFEFALAFAVLHHLPGELLRHKVLQTVRRLLLPGGRLILSTWQFLNSPRLRLRIQPWERAGLSPSQVDPGDYLLDWRSGGSGLRYVHNFSLDELSALAEVCGFSVLESFWSDGENGCSGLYQIWQ